VQESGQLCFECHQLNVQQLGDIHAGIAPDPASCTSCHDSHGGPQPSLLYPVQHTPFTEGRCADCHEESTP
jgi:predicted CXXCH cytochrome family protein